MAESLPLPLTGVLLLSILKIFVYCQGGFLPDPIAAITVSAPVTISPPANTPGIEVIKFSSTKIVPRGLTLIRLSASPQEGIGSLAYSHDNRIHV